MTPNKELKWFIVVGEIQSAEQSGFTYMLRPVVDERKIGHYELSISCGSGNGRRGIHDKYSDLIQAAKELAQAHADAIRDAVWGGPLGVLCHSVDDVLEAYGNSENYELCQIEKEIGDLSAARKAIE